MAVYLFYIQIKK